MRTIVTGVIHNNSAAWFFDDTYDAISLEFEQHVANCPNDDHDDCWCTDGNETLLIGFEKCKYSDPDAWHTHFMGYGYKPEETTEN